MKTTHAITGAFGYTGKYIANLLLAENQNVITLTNSTNRPNPFKGKIKAIPFNFDKPDLLAESLKDVSVLYNTYWVRFNHKTFKHAEAVENTKILFNAAKKAGVERIVHVSITKPSLDSPLEYFNGKAVLEKALQETGIPHSILRPAVIFGHEDVLINNIAWTLRKFPFFATFSDGSYKIQPIYVEDMAELAVKEGKNTGSRIVDAIGPEIFTYRDLVKTIGKLIGKNRPVIGVPDEIGYWCSWIIGKFVGDTFVTREEIKGLRANLLFTDAEPTGKIKLTDWITEHKDTLGKYYSSEVGRRLNVSADYDELRHK